MSIIATIAAIAVPVGAWITAMRLEETVPLPSGGASPAPAGTATGGADAAPEQACLNPMFFSPTLQAPIPQVAQMNAAAQAILDGVQFYFTPDGQEALAGLLIQNTMVSPTRAYRGNRSVTVRTALATLFPNCDWNRPFAQYSAEQYSAWLSAWPLAAAIEAELGMPNLDVGPIPGASFVSRAAVAMDPVGGTLATFPPGTYVRLLTAEEGGDNGVWVDATVGNVGVAQQEVIVETAGPIGTALGFAQGTKHLVDLPTHAMTVLQATQPNPRMYNPGPMRSGMDVWRAGQRPNPGGMR